MADDNQLQQLRGNIINNLATISGDLAGSDAISLNTLLLVAHNTGKTELLNKAYDRIQAMDDPAAKADAYLDLLDEVDYLLEEPRNVASTMETPVSDEHSSHEQS